MKKGFTLIELLAVIVILAIIALVAVPVVSNVIASAKIDSGKDSVHGYIEAVNNKISVDRLKGQTVSNGLYSRNELADVKIYGDIDGAYVQVEDGKIKELVAGWWDPGAGSSLERIFITLHTGL